MLAARTSVVCLALLVCACVPDQPERGAYDLSTGRDPSTGVDAPGSSGDSGAQGAPDAGVCGAVQASAKALLESHQTCAVDQDCRDDAIVAPCPAPGGCDVFVRKDTDVLWSAMAELKAEFEASCGRCPGLKCKPRPVRRGYCDATKHCAARDVPAASGDAASPSAPHDAGPASDASLVDASAIRDASSDAGSTDAQADAGGAAGPGFGCKVNLDCVITNVGNCCGYYPRCANVNATFSPPVCTGGQAGVCGFPSIDSCECRQNRCVSLQAGNPI